MLSSIYDVRPQTSSITEGLTAPGVNLQTSVPQQQKLIPQYANASTPDSKINVGALASNYGGVVNSFLKAAIPNNSVNTNGYIDKAATQSNLIGNTVDSARNTIAPMLGPLGIGINEGLKLGENIGNAIGGDGGTVVSSIFNPINSITSALVDPDLSTGDKVLSFALPFYGALKSKKAQKRRQQDFVNKQRIGEKIMSEARSQADARMQQGLEQIEDLRAVREKQLGFLKSNY